MTSSANKKVVIQRFDREPVQGFVNTGTFLTAHGIEVLSVSGVLSTITYADVKSVFFVTEFNVEPGRARRSFLNRPRVDGLWVRLTFRDGDTLEGVMDNNLLHIESDGMQITPPGGAARVFVPRRALTEVQVLGIVGSPLRAASARKAKEGREQIGLFEGGDVTESQ